MRGGLNRALEHVAVLLVVMLSAPLAALLFAVLATYLILVVYPLPAGEPGMAWATFGVTFALAYLTICFFAVRRK